MHNIFLYIFLASILIPCSYLKVDHFRRMYEYAKYKRKKFRELIDLVQTKYDSRFDIYRVSFTMLAQAFYQDILNYFDNRVVKKAKNTYEIRYQIEGKNFKQVVKFKRGPSKIHDVLNQDGKSILTEFRQFVTPGDKICSELITPNYLGYKKNYYPYVIRRKIFLK